MEEIQNEEHEDLYLDVVNKKSQRGETQQPEIKKKSEESEENFFEVEEEDQGDGFMATLPFKGALVAPSHYRAFNSSPPHNKLQIEYAWGYRCHDCRQNLYFLSDPTKIVYMTAAIGIVHDTNKNTQTFFGGSEDRHTKNFHCDDIISLAIHPNKEIIATGEVGKNPSIFIWDWKTCTPVTKPIKQGVNTRGVKTLSFSKTGIYLASSSNEDKHVIYVWDWGHGKLVASYETGTDAIINTRFSSTDENTLAYCGKNGIKFLNVIKKEMHKGIFGKIGIKDLYCVDYTKNGSCVTGSEDGTIIEWIGTSVKKEVKGAHKGFVISVACKEEVIVSSGRDFKINMYDDSLKVIQTFTLNSYAISLDVDDNLNILAGTRNGEIQKIVGHAPQLIMKKHRDGELWGVDICPKTNHIVTTCDDNKVLAYDVKNHSFVSEGVINKVAGKKYKIGGASTLSLYPPNQCARAVAISNSGHVALGINNGELCIRESVNNLDKEIFRAHDAKEWIEVIKYSPNGELLGVGSHDNNIYIYKIHGAKYALSTTLKKHNSFITSFDWSSNSKFIRSNCGAYELLFYDVSSGNQLPSGASSLKDEKWHTLNCKIAWPTYPGIYPPCTDGSHVNGVDLSPNEEIIATADDWGQVNLYRNPALKGAKCVSFMAHSEHVVRVKWSSDGQYLYSIGGYDQTLIKWRVQN